MKHILKNIAVLCCIAIICSFAAVAASDKRDARGEELVARYSHLECRVNLVMDQADIVNTYVPIEGLAAKEAALTADLATLKGYADNNNASLFTRFVVQTLKDDVQALNAGVLGVRSVIRNISAADKKAVRDAWKQSVADFATCNSNTRRNMLDSRIAFMNEEIADWNAAIADMKAKGLDTTKMESIVAQANQLLDLLNQAANATDDEFVSKVNEARDLHLHLWANFHIAKVEAYLAKVESAAAENGLTAKVQGIKDKLSEAGTLAQKGKKYDEGGFQTTWQDIRDASKMLRDLVKELRTSAP